MLFTLIGGIDHKEFSLLRSLSHCKLTFTRSESEYENDIAFRGVRSKMSVLFILTNGKNHGQFSL